MTPEQQAILDRKALIKEELNKYRTFVDGWGGEGSEAPTEQDIMLAMDFIDLLPSGCPLPTPMISSNGQIGLYWDTDVAYADINIDENHTFSVFIRSRVGDKKETFFDRLELENFNPEWFKENLIAIYESRASAEPPVQSPDTPS